MLPETEYHEICICDASGQKGPRTIMKLNLASKFLIAALCGCAYTPAFAGYVYVVEARVSGGAQNSLFTLSGLAISSGKSTAAPLAGWTGGALTGTGSYYAGDTTPVKYGDWSFTPGVGKGGYYDVYGTWQNVTAAQNMPPAWTIHNAGADATASPSQVTGGNAWNLLASGLQFNQGTAYTTRLATLGSNTAGKRASFDSVAWAASTPSAVSYTGPANGATDVAVTGTSLSWTAGSKDSFFDVWFGTTSGSLTEIAAGLSVTTLSLSLDSQNLQGGTQYFWRVDAGNVDINTAGTESGFTTVVVPEPSTALLSLLGGLGLAAWITRRRTT